MEVEAGAWGCVCAAVDGARLLVVCMMGRLSLPLSPFRHAQWRAVPIPTEPTELQAELKAMGIEAMREAVRLFKKDDLTRARYKTAIASSCLERHCCLAELSLQLSKRGWEVRS